MRPSRAILGALILCTAAASMTDAAQAQRYDRQDRIERKIEKKKTKNTLIGVGIGLLGGALLSGGDPWATAAGAAAGGLVGNATTDDRRGDWRRDQRRRDDHRDRRWDDRRD